MRMDRWMGGQTGMMNLTAASHNFVNMPKNDQVNEHSIVLQISK
jgi:hypothetical protein